MNRPLVTPRLLVRALDVADAAQIAAYRSDPQVAALQGWGPSFTLEQARDLIEEMRGRQPGEPGWFQFAVTDRTTGQVLGDLGFRSFPERHAEIGFTLARHAQGRGVAQEAVSCLLELAFGPLGLHRVIAAADPRNRAASRLLLRLGFRHEGRQLESYFDDGTWLDEDLYALLDREWLERPGQGSN